VEVEALDLARLEPLLGARRMQILERTADAAQQALAGRSVLNINSTAKGGGVAEMLQTLIAYARGAGTDTRWLVIEGDPEFFAITKRIHNGIYGSPGDGGPLGASERRHYERVLRRNAEELRALVRPGDIVLLHDPQTIGLAEDLQRAGAHVVWRCHIGSDQPNEWSQRAWEFIRRYGEYSELFVVSRPSFAPPFSTPDRVQVIPPSIDPFAAKNEPMSRRTVRLALGYVGLLDGEHTPPLVRFARRDGSPGRINRHVDVIQSGPPPAVEVPLVVQASRWDGMKDMAGVMEGFAHHLDPALGAHLILIGPAVRGVADDPEAAAVYDECVARWRALPHALRGRIHLACVPMVDPDENAAIINALQRHASVVVQKSLAEGFGLTVTEAMWKSRPVVASAVGGIADQIEHGRGGLLLPDPRDLAEFGGAIERVLTTRELAERLGSGARERVLDRYLGDRHLERYATIFQALAKTS
jgi:trehalose synthase